MAALLASDAWEAMLVHDHGIPAFFRGGVLPNVWLGVSVENQQYADLRIPHLLATPAAVRFLSVEPMLGPVVLNVDGWACPGETGIDWVIVGGESGPGARPLDIEWIRSVIAQCREVGIPVFVKQLGAEPGFKGEPGSFHHYDKSTGLFIKRLEHRKGGDWAEWPEDLRVRLFPMTGAPA